MVSLTFDDGWRSQYTNAIPLLDRYGFRPTQYIHAGGASDPEHVTEAHSVIHAHLTALSPTQLQRELVDSRQTLEAIIGAPVIDFATPYGDYNPAVLAAISTIYRNTSHRKEPLQPSDCLQPELHPHPGLERGHDLARKPLELTIRVWPDRNEDHRVSARRRNGLD